MKPQILQKETVNRPTPNPYLASPLYAITHFDSSQSDSTPYGPLRRLDPFNVDPTTEPIVYGGPLNIIMLASTDPNCMWQVGTDRVSYVKKAADQWVPLAIYQALAEASKNSDNYFPPIPDDNFRKFGEASAVGKTAAEMDKFMQSLFGANYSGRFGNGIYSLVDIDNVLYTNYLDTLFGFALTNPDQPSDGITASYKLEGVIEAFEGQNPPPDTRLFGLSMTYDGHLIVVFNNGVGVIDRNLDVGSIFFYKFSDAEYVSNSIAVEQDENNSKYSAMYIATGWSFAENTSPISKMHKLIWTGISISDKPGDGAWNCEYDNSGKNQPPIIKIGDGTGSTPTLMGFGDDPDKLVVLTDGAEQMKLVAFWRNEIPKGSQRIADQIQVTCGLNPLSTRWIQSEQSVVVYEYGAFVVNNIPEYVNPDVQAANKFVQVSLMGPGQDCSSSYGVERFQWNPSTKKWSSLWTRSDISSTSMVPVHSQSGNMALVNGWGASGWEVWGLDWDSGKTVHQTIFGEANFGNGAYAILQYLEDQDLVFNSIVGPLRVHYGARQRPTLKK